MANIELGGEPYFPNPYNIVPPPVCVHWATDIMCDEDASPLEWGVAMWGLDTSTTCFDFTAEGAIARVLCRVKDCPVKCDLYGAVDTDGTFYPEAAGADEDDDDTDFGNCFKSWQPNR